jgi:aryl-alcohol dehydrogenase-like predicted oxidoreductase
MRQRPLGRTGLKVSEIGFGAWAVGGNVHGNSYGPTDDATSVAAVRRAFELGCTFFDTADVYGWGHSEAILGEALEGRRDDVVIATKVGGDFYHGGVRMNFSPDYVVFALERSLARLRTDYVDLYQLHNPPPPLLGDEALYETLDLLKAEQKIRHYGISIHQPAEGRMAIEAGRAETLQLPFSIFRQEWREELFPMARRQGIGIIAREPLGNGFLTGKYDEDATFPPGDIRHNWPPGMIAGRVRAAKKLTFLVKGDTKTLAQAALKFVLSHAEVSVTIPGAKTPDQVEDNVAASEGTPLEDADIAAVVDLYADGFRLR